MERKITALKAQQHNQSRVSIYLDGEYAFGLSKIVAAWLCVGQILSDKKIKALQTEEAREVAYQKALHFISYRPRSEQEVKARLKSKGFGEAVITAVAERLQQNRFLGDEQFAQDWVENRSTFRPRSKRLLRYELRQKGVSEDDITKALDGVVDETDLAYQAANHYAGRLKDLDWEKFRKRLVAFLMRRGFSYGTISPVVSRVWSELQPEEPET